MYLGILVLVDLLFVADIMCAEAFKVKPLEIGTSGTIPCDHVENDPEVRLVQWYKSRSIDAFENGDASIASWANGAHTSLPNYHMENTTKSLVIDNATLEGEGLYKCFAARGDLYTGSHYYIRTVIYALPRMDPEIVLHTDLVHCTVEHVKPMIYPVLNFEGIPDSTTETNTVLNEDGTYTTSVYCTLPQTKSVSRVHCSFSYLHCQRVASLDLRDTTSDSLTEDKTTTVSPMSTSVTSAGDGCTCTTIGHQMPLVVGMMVLGVMVAVFLLLLMKKKAEGMFYRGVHTLKKVKESEVKIVLPAEGMGAEMTARDGLSQSFDFNEHFLDAQ